jgi:histidine ammonia-lyase
MIAQYTQAALVSDCKRLAVPASVDSIPSSAMQEDHVSMGWHAARKLRKSLDNLRMILAIELVAASQAIEQRAPHQPAATTGALLGRLRKVVAAAGPDRFLAPELEKAAALLLETV